MEGSKEEISKKLRRKSLKVKQLEEEIQNLKGILEEQSKAIVEIREEKDQLLEEKQSWLKEKDNLNQKILTKIYDSLLENKSNGKEEQTEEIKFTQEEITNFCTFLATQFDLNTELYKSAEPIMKNRHSSKSLGKPSANKASPKKEKDSHGSKSRRPTTGGGERPSDLGEVPKKIERIDSTIDPNLQTSQDSRAYSFATVSKRPSSTHNRTKHHDKPSLDIKHNSGAQTVSERKSKHKDKEHNSAVEEIFTNAPKRKHESEKRMHSPRKHSESSPRKDKDTLKIESPRKNNSQKAQSSEGKNENTPRKTQSAKHEVSQSDSTPISSPRKDSIGVSERRMTKSDLPLATNNLTPPTEIIVTTPKIEEIKQEEDLFYVYVDNVLLQSVPSQPSANVHKLVLKICHKQNFDIDKFVFKDKAGQTIDLQPTTLQKHLPDKYIAFVKRDIDEQGSPSQKKKKITKNYSLDTETTRSKRSSLSMHTKSRSGDHEYHENEIPLHLENKNPTQSSSTKKDSPPKVNPTASKAIRNTIDIVEIKEKITQAWSISVQKSPLPGDFCRLAPRISFTDTRNNKSINYIPQDGLLPVQYAKELISQLILALETEEQVNKIKALLNEGDNIGDGGLWIRSIFQELGDECKTIKFLMAIHQGILTPAANQIKVVLFSNTNQFTKDVQGKEGWKIELALSDSETRISHLRKEVSMIPGDNGYSFEWKLSIFLNPNFQSLENISLLAHNLQVGSKCDPVLKQKIQSCLDQFKS